MIQINVVTNSTGGVAIPSGSVLNINPTIITTKILIDGVVTLRYNVGLDANLFKSLAIWKSALDVPVYLRDTIVEYPISYFLEDVALDDLNPLRLQTLFQEVIENGIEGLYPGVGAGKTSIVY